MPPGTLGNRWVCFILKRPPAIQGLETKGGENSFVLTSRGGGVLLDDTLGGSAGLPCQAGLRPHSRLFIQFVRRLTTKELVFVRVVALQNARVNDKKVNESMRKSATTPHLILDQRARRARSRARGAACSAREMPLVLQAA